MRKTNFGNVVTLLTSLLICLVAAYMVATAGKKDPPFELSNRFSMYGDTTKPTPLDSFQLDAHPWSPHNLLLDIQWTDTMGMDIAVNPTGAPTEMIVLAIMRMYPWINFVSVEQPLDNITRIRVTDTLGAGTVSWYKLSIPLPLQKLQDIKTKKSNVVITLRLEKWLWLDKCPSPTAPWTEGSISRPV